MGYTTTYAGQISITPPLPAETVTRYTAFYDDNPHVLSSPSSGSREKRGYCQWEIVEDGSKLVWDGGEKFYDGPAWLKYVIDTFVKPAGSTAAGALLAQGEEVGDVWYLIVEDGRVYTQDVKLTPQPDLASFQPRVEVT